jgi:hypothetical protein
MNRTMKGDLAAWFFGSGDENSIVEQRRKFGRRPVETYQTLKKIIYFQWLLWFNALSVGQLSHFHTVLLYDPRHLGTRLALFCS